MFTGLIQDVGVIDAVGRAAAGVEMRIRSRLAADLRVGDSVAVNGVCVTAAGVTGEHFEATVVPETIGRTTLGAITVGSRVNLEAALRIGDSLGGHIVQGHIDGCGTVTAQGRQGDAWVMSVAPPVDLARYMVEKGSIAIDGVSLTIAALAQNSAFSVALVPHTLEATALAERREGDRVNLEVDVLAKYVERLLAPRQGGAADSGNSKISEAWLREQGYGA